MRPDLERRVAFLERGLRRLRNGIDQADMAVNRALSWYTSISANTGTPPTIPSDPGGGDPPGNAESCCAGVQIPDELSVIRQGAVGLALTYATGQARWSTGLIDWPVDLLYGRSGFNGNCILQAAVGSAKAELILQCQLNGTWVVTFRGSACNFTGQAFPSPYQASVGLSTVFSQTIAQNAVVCDPFGFVLNNPGIPPWSDWWGLAQTFPWVFTE